MSRPTQARRCSPRAVAALGVIAIVVSCHLAVASLQDFDQTSCDEFRLPARSVAGRQVGPSS